DERLAARVAGNLPGTHESATLVEGRRLEAVRLEHHLPAAQVPRSLLHRIHQRRAEAVAAAVLAHPERVDEAAAAPFPSVDARDDLAVLVVDHEGDRVPLGDPRYPDIVVVDLLAQQPADLGVLDPAHLAHTAASTVVPISVSPIPASWIGAGRSRSTTIATITLIVENCAAHTDATLTGPRVAAAANAPNATASTAPHSAIRRSTGRGVGRQPRTASTGTSTAIAVSRAAVTALNAPSSSVAPNRVSIRPNCRPARRAQPAPAAVRSPGAAHASE